MVCLPLMLEPGWYGMQQERYDIGSRASQDAGPYGNFVHDNSDSFSGKASTELMPYDRLKPSPSFEQLHRSAESIVPHPAELRDAPNDSLKPTMSMAKTPISEKCLVETDEKNPTATSNHKRGEMAVVPPLTRRGVVVESSDWEAQRQLDEFTEFSKESDVVPPTSEGKESTSEAGQKDSTSVLDL